MEWKPPGILLQGLAIPGQREHGEMPGEVLRARGSPAWVSAVLFKLFLGRRVLAAGALSSWPLQLAGILSSEHY